MLKIPVGYRFFLKDDELISEYVLKKVLNQPLSLPSAAKMDNAFVYGSNGMEPWNLCTHKTALLDDEKHYFFTELKRVSKNRLARTVGVYGSWHVTSTSMIYDPGTHNVIGIKKLMNFKVNEEGKMKKTDWIMHEFSLAGVSLVGIDQKRSSNIVLCVIRNYQKKNKGSASDPLDTTTNVGDLYPRHDSVTQIGSPSSRGLKRMSLSALHQKLLTSNTTWDSTLLLQSGLHQAPIFKFKRESNRARGCVDLINICVCACPIHQSILITALLLVLLSVLARFWRKTF